MKKQTKYILGAGAVLGGLYLLKKRKDKVDVSTVNKEPSLIDKVKDLVTPNGTTDTPTKIVLENPTLENESLDYTLADLDNENIRITIYNRETPKSTWYWQFNPLGSNVKDERLLGKWCGVYRYDQPKAGTFINEVGASMSAIKRTISANREKWAVVFG